MKVRLKYDHHRRLLTVNVRGAPHRRIHRKVLEQYRVEIWRAAKEAGLDQMSHQISLSALFIDPTGPDLDNLLTALFQALDGKTGKGPTLLKDDRQIVFLDQIGIMLP
jgi:Holliday junction resolvase RusA-like endonuclease